jgi:Co/Zn/Cd efflux system component
MSRQLERNSLLLLFALNGTMFGVEVVAGYLADSMGLVADGLDMLADAAVYGVALLAIGESASRKVRAAFVAGYLQLALASAAVIKLGLALLHGSEPIVATMIGVSLVAMCVNVIALVTLRKHRHGDVHLRAAWIFSATDVQVNIGVIVAAILVRALESPVPDLVAGAAICILVFRSVARILGDARRAHAALN